jgi:flagellar protein FliO/FliZ
VNVFNACVKKIKISGLFLATLSTQVLASDKPAVLEPAVYGGRVLFFLFLVVGLIVLLAWLVHKSKMTSGLMQNNTDLKVIASHSLGVKEKIVVLKVGDTQFLLGVTAQNINLLSELKTPLELKSSQAMSFADLLKKAVKS